MTRSASISYLTGPNCLSLSSNRRFDLSAEASLRLQLVIQLGMNNKQKTIHVMKSEPKAIGVATIAKDRKLKLVSVP